MAKVITTELPEEAKCTGEVHMENIELAAIDYNNQYINLYWLLDTEEKDTYLIKNSFLIDGEVDIAYFNHPMFSLLNVHNEKVRPILQRIIANFNAKDSYYTDFTPVDIIGDSPLMYLMQKGLGGEVSYKKLITPFSIYICLAIVRSAVCSKYLFYPNITRDSSYKGFKMCNCDGLTYLGTEVIHPDRLYHNYFFILSDNKKVGLCCPYEDRSPFLITKNYKKESFTLFYQNNMILEPNRIVPMFWKRVGDAKPMLYVGLIRVKAKEIYLFTQDQYMKIIDIKTTIKEGK